MLRSIYAVYCSIGSKQSCLFFSRPRRFAVIVVDISDENEKRKGEKTACRLVKFFIERDSGKDYGIYK